MAQHSPAPPLRAQKVLDYFDSLRPEYKRGVGTPAYFLGMFVIHNFLGGSWIKTHIDPGNGGILSFDASSNNLDRIKAYRVADLGECLLNLQHIYGFSGLIERIRTADNPEPGIGELHIAKMLYINNWNFRFVAPTGKKGEDYGLEIDYFGQIACADTKCKIEEMPLSASTITNTLSGSRRQLPADSPGIFFMKLPQHWIEESEFARTVVRGAHDFFCHGNRSHCIGGILFGAYALAQ